MAAWCKTNVDVHDKRSCGIHIAWRKDGFASVILGGVGLCAKPSFVTAIANSTVCALEVADAYAHLVGKALHVTSWTKVLQNEILLI